VSQLISAQELSVTGKVTDNAGEPLPGVNVVIKGKNLGTTTDFDGKYTIKVHPGDVLAFSSLGYETVQKPVNKGGVINVQLKESASQLNQIVVTAMGIKKNEKALGYASQQVKMNDLKQVNQNALANLQGQVSGVQINQSSGAVGGGVDILIRGVKSLDPSVSNQPLIIVDGIRVSNDIVAGNVLPSTGSNAPSSSEQFSFANRAIDLNPDDIESINVLKGAAAAALYGIDAANGAIVITTKKGIKGKPQFTLTTKTSASQVNKYVELQDKWREGRFGVSKITQDPNNPNITTQVNGYGASKGYWLINNATYSFHTWGPEYGDDPTITFHDIYRDFFQTGINNNINFSVKGGGEKYNYYLSLGDNMSSGIVPNTDYNKLNVHVKADYQLTKKFNLEVSSSYSNSSGKLPNNGDKSIMSSMSYWSPSIDVNDYLLPDGRQKNYTPYWIDNPRYFAEKSGLQTDVSRIITGANAKWNVTDNFNINYRISNDNYVDARNRFVPADLDVGTQVKGFIINQNIRFNSLNSLLLASYNYNLNDDMKFTFMAGNEITKQKRISETQRGETLILPYFNNISNAENFYAFSNEIGKNRLGVFGEIDMAYKDQLFVSLTGRNDWSSTLPKQNRSFFYPSVNVSYIATNLIDQENKIFSLAKFRFSWANVGKDAPEGILGTHWAISNYPNNNGSAGGIYPYTTEGDINLKPENQRTTEFGFDFRFFDNRLRLDYTYYDNLNTDLIARIPVSYTSGKTSIWTNAGSLKNTGHEILLSGRWIDKTDFNWTTTVNWSTNKGVVESLPDEIPYIIYANSGYAGVVSMVKQGDAPGTLYGYTWKYNENGDRIIDSNGLPIIDTSKKVVVGQAFPDWVGSITNSFNYKDFNLSFNFEYKKGGDAYDAGQRNSIRDGTIKITELRYQNVVLDGVQDDGNGGWKPNETPVYIDEGYYRSSSHYNRASEILVQDASWVKLRNVSLTYTFPKTWLKNSFINKVQVNASGNNFLLWTPFRGFDPEGSQFSAGSNTYGFTGLNIPLTQTYSLGLKVNF
ncbi:MAG TPA: SusC/RagA family TonB-linked outer membrane protein, partial [Flavobacteriales bacterium]|nr:SusC/RagA family TonB-linked outer membrane protein [Flavobacteriales bacterium]